MATATATGIFPARTKTQKALKANILRLTRPDGPHLGMWTLADRDTAHAREAMERWVASGAIEKVSLHRGYTSEYRVTQAGVEEDARHEARVDYLAACVATITEQEMVYGAAMGQVRTGCEDVIAHLAPIDIEASAAAIGASQGAVNSAWHGAAQAWNDMRYAGSIIQQQRRMMEQERQRIEATGDDYAEILAEATMRASGSGAPITVDADADPLGGDA